MIDLLLRDSHASLDQFGHGGDDGGALRGRFGLPSIDLAVSKLRLPVG